MTMNKVKTLDDLKKMRESLRASLDLRALVTQTGCMGYCYAEPTIEIKLPGQEPLVFGYVDKAKVEEIIDKYIRKGILVDGIIPVTYTTVKPE